MAQSQLNLFNLALQHVGMKKITSTTGTDPSTVACNNYYEPCRDDLFREWKWPFANVQDTLVTTNASQAAVPLGWTYSYDYPTQNCATVWTVFNDDTYDHKEGQDFEVYCDPTGATRLICTDCDSAYYEYTRIITDPTFWDTKFYIALSYRLAASIAHVLLGDADKGFTLMQVSNAYISDAKRISSYERKKKPQQKSGYQECR
jgi:hypothetical protein